MNFVTANQSGIAMVSAVTALAGGLLFAIQGLVKPSEAIRTRILQNQFSQFNERANDLATVFKNRSTCSQALKNVFVNISKLRDPKGMIVDQDIEVQSVKLLKRNEKIANGLFIDEMRMALDLSPTANQGLAANEYDVVMRIIAKRSKGLGGNLARTFPMRILTSATDGTIQNCTVTADSPPIDDFDLAAFCHMMDPTGIYDPAPPFGLPKCQINYLGVFGEDLASYQANQALGTIASNQVTFGSQVYIQGEILLETPPPADAARTPAESQFQRLCRSDGSSALGQNCPREMTEPQGEGTVGTFDNDTCEPAIRRIVNSFFSEGGASHTDFRVLEDRGIVWQPRDPLRQVVLTCPNGKHLVNYKSEKGPGITTAYARFLPPLPGANVDMVTMDYYYFRSSGSPPHSYGDLEQIVTSDRACCSLRF